MLYSEYRFRRDTLQEVRAQAYTDRMTAASFTAWQIICSNGGKTNWKKYIDSLGLGVKEAVSKSEKVAAVSVALDVHKMVANRSVK